MSNEVVTELEDLRKEDFFSKKQQENEKPKQFETNKMDEYLNMIGNGLAGLEAQDLHPERFAKVLKTVNDAIACCNIIHKENKKTTRQTTLDQYVHY
jgi:hypothetical protein